MRAGRGHLPLRAVVQGEGAKVPPKILWKTCSGRGGTWGEVSKQLLYSTLVKLRKLSFVLVGGAKDPQGPLCAANTAGVACPGTCMPYLILTPQNLDFRPLLSPLIL